MTLALSLGYRRSRSMIAERGTDLNWDERRETKSACAESPADAWAAVTSEGVRGFDGGDDASTYRVEDEDAGL